MGSFTRSTARRRSSLRIANGPRHEQPLLSLEGTQADFHGKLTTIAALTVQLQPRTHRPGSGLTEETGPAPLVMAAVALRYQKIHGLSQEFFSRIAKQAFQL